MVAAMALMARSTARSIRSSDSTTRTRCIPETASRWDSPLFRNAASSAGSRSASPSTNARAMGAASGAKVASILVRTYARARSIHAGTPNPRRSTSTVEAAPLRRTPRRALRSVGSPSSGLSKRSSGAISVIARTASPRARSSRSTMRAVRNDSNFWTAMSSQRACSTSTRTRNMDCLRAGDEATRPSSVQRLRPADQVGVCASTALLRSTKSATTRCARSMDTARISIATDPPITIVLHDRREASASMTPPEASVAAGWRSRSGPRSAAAAMTSTKSGPTADASVAVSRSSRSTALSICTRRRTQSTCHVRHPVLPSGNGSRCVSRTNFFCPWTGHSSTTALVPSSRRFRSRFATTRFATKPKRVRLLDLTEWMPRMHLQTGKFSIARTAMARGT